MVVKDTEQNGEKRRVIGGIVIGIKKEEYLTL